MCEFVYGSLTALCVPMHYHTSPSRSHAIGHQMIHNRPRLPTEGRHNSEKDFFPHWDYRQRTSFNQLAESFKIGKKIFFASCELSKECWSTSESIATLVEGPIGSLNLNHITCGSWGPTPLMTTSPSLSEDTAAAGRRGRWAVGNWGRQVLGMNVRVPRQARRFSLATWCCW